MLTFCDEKEISSFDIVATQNWKKFEASNLKDMEFKMVYLCD
jgi:hypothetical protein